MFHIRLQNICLLDFSRSSFKIFGIDQAFQLLNFFTIQTVFALADFEAIELRWIVATGYHHAAIGFKVMQGKVGHGCGNPSNIHNIASGRGQGFG